MAVIRVRNVVRTCYTSGHTLVTQHNTFGITMRHFLNLEDWTSEELQGLLDLAVELKRELRYGGNEPRLRGKVLAMVFQKPSLRTRVSFEVGMQQLGGTAINMLPDEIGLGKRESVADIARVLGSYTHGIMARVFGHSIVVELARWAGVPVINGLSDMHHPCQAMADALTIRERLGGIKGVRVAYVGDGNNVAASFAQIVANCGGHFVIGTPQGYELNGHLMEAVSDLAERNGGSFTAVHDPRTAVENADVVYTDTWVSMGQEAEHDRRLREFAGWQVNADLVKLARKDAIVMHCLPAHRGVEITDEVADGPQSAIFQQAENRLHAQKAILVKLLSDT